MLHVAVYSGPCIKISKFHFDTSAGPSAHIAKIQAKFNSRLWSLRYLKKAGMSTLDLLKAYTCFLRPLLEYAVPSFHSMMNEEQTKTLERLQARALKIVYGFHLSYAELLEKSSLETLKNRRIELTDKFAIKMQKNKRFADLFPLRPEDQLRVRNPKPFLEFQAKTARLYNSPIFYMRRRLNALALEASNAPTTTTGPSVDTRCDFLFDEWR